MKEIEQIVKDYLNTENTDYALMINGDWGCGKTYYVKKHLFVEITSIDSHLKNDKDKPIRYEPLYISLYGIADIQDVLYKIQLELNSWMKSKAWGFFRGAINKAASVIGTDATKEDEKEILSALSIKKNKVLFFDDLERIDTKKISFSSVLGQINHFTEQDNLKVIIVCNSSKTDEIFNQINEKTVRFSCLYDPDIGSVYDQIITEYSLPYQNFLKEKKHVIIEVFNTAKYKNLRTLRFILDIFQKIYSQADKAEYKNEILDRFLLFATIYSVEYKLGLQSPEDLNSLRNVGPFFLSDIDFNNLIGNESKEQDQKEKSYAQLFNEKYTNLTESFYYIQEIADYIHNGYLDQEKLSRIISDIIEEKKRKQGTEEDKLINEIKNWRELKDEEFNPLIDKIFAKIDDGEFTLSNYPVIFAEFLQFEFYNLDNIKVNANLIDRFKKGIDKAKITHTYSDSLRAKFPYWSESDTTQARGKFNNICEYTLRANNFALGKIYTDISNSIITYLEKNESEELRKAITEPANLNSPFFGNIDLIKFFDLLLKANSETINAFNIGIYGRYSDSDINHEPVYQNEKGFFEGLYELIVEHIAGIENRKISTVRFIDLEKNLRRFVKKK